MDLDTLSKIGGLVALVGPPIVAVLPTVRDWLFGTTGSPIAPSPLARASLAGLSGLFGAGLALAIVSLRSDGGGGDASRLVAISYRVGPNGVERPGVDPGYFQKTTGGDREFIDVPSSENAPICMLSDILHDPPNSGGSCELHHDNNSHEPWKIRANAQMKCRVTCFTLEFKK